MFIGHFGAGFAAKSIDRRPSLGTLFLAAQVSDLLWPVLLLFGIEQVRIDPGNTAFTPLNFIYYPFSHSFLGVLAWGVLFGVLYYLIKRNLKSAVVLGALVLSHWFLDLLTHRPDLPLSFWNNTKVGLGLWNSVILSIVVEGLIFGSGVLLYSIATRARNLRGKITLWSLVTLLTVFYIMNIFGPPPTDTGPIAITGLSQWLLVGWGYWIDRNRTAAAAAAPLRFSRSGETG